MFCDKLAYESFRAGKMMDAHTELEANAKYNATVLR
jgi:hypothetical protein